MTRDNFKPGDRVAVCLPDGNVLKAKVIEIVTANNSKYYLVQSNNSYALVSERDLIQKSST